MHEKWHVAYEEALRVPFVVSSPLLPGGVRELDVRTNHADVIPTLLGLAGDRPRSDARCAGGRPRRCASVARTTTVTEPEPDEHELYELTLDPLEERNLAYPGNADDSTRALQQTMLGLLDKQLAAKRLTPTAGERPGYRPPAG